MQLDAEMAEVQRREHAARGVRRQQHADRLGKEADVLDLPGPTAAAQFEEALAGGGPGAVL
jgi:branched-subunit amino acid aminotransferase/4-amino-4-deoxychorismate lyase